MMPYEQPPRYQPRGNTLAVGAMYATAFLGIPMQSSGTLDHLLNAPQSTYSAPSQPQDWGSLSPKSVYGLQRPIEISYEDNRRRLTIPGGYVGMAMTPQSDLVKIFPEMMYRPNVLPVSPTGGKGAAGGK